MYQLINFYLRDMIKKIVREFLEQNKRQYTTPEQYQNVLDVMDQFEQWLYHATVDVAKTKD